MPVVPFETLPDASRVWVFGADTPLKRRGDDGPPRSEWIATSPSGRRTARR